MPEKLPNRCGDCGDEWPTTSLEIAEGHRAPLDCSVLSGCDGGCSGPISCQNTLHAVDRWVSNFFCLRPRILNWFGLATRIAQVATQRSNKMKLQA
jgi:hypothetical protein